MSREPAMTQQVIQVGRQFKALREALGLQQNKAAEATGVTPTAFSNYENGSRPMPGLIAARFCNRYGGTLDWIYRGDPSKLPHDLAEKVLLIMAREPAPHPPAARGKRRRGKKA